MRLIRIECEMFQIFYFYKMFDRKKDPNSQPFKWTKNSTTRPILV